MERTKAKKEEVTRNASWACSQFAMPCVSLQLLETGANLVMAVKREGKDRNNGESSAPSKTNFAIEFFCLARGGIEARTQTRNVLTRRETTRAELASPRRPIISIMSAGDV